MKPLISILSAILIAVLNLSGAATYSYNGNISSRSFDGKRYDYLYDSHNRLTEARFSDSGKDFSARYTYDCRANITSLVRKGIVDKVGTAETYGTLDSLAISYSGNLISGITARSGALPFEGMTGLGRNGDFIDFAYDSSGRLYQDSSRGISDIIYDNDGNRTQTITENGTIYDFYDGAGNHLRTEYSENGKPTVVREYTGAGHIITDSVVTRTPCPGGYFSGRGGYPLYYLTDWQGNNIATLNALGATVSSHRYYPYGEPWREPSREEFLFSGNERIRYSDINDYDFHARRYNAALPRFDKPDRFNEKYPWLSPYAYCAGNPINLIDRNGEDWTISWHKDADGVTHYNITITGVVYNSSGSKFDMEKFASSVKSQIENVFTFSGENFEVTTTANIKPIKKPSEIGETDHVFHIVNQENFEKKEDNTKTLASAKNCSLLIKIGTDLMRSTLNGKNKRSIAHELGHTGGLHHPDPATLENTGLNLMTQIKSLDKGTRINDAVNIEEAQLNTIINNYTNKKLNKGPAYSTGRYFSIFPFGFQTYKKL